MSSWQTIVCFYYQTTRIEISRYVFPILHGAERLVSGVSGGQGKDVGQTDVLGVLKLCVV